MTAVSRAVPLWKGDIRGEVRESFFSFVHRLERIIGFHEAICSWSLCYCPREISAATSIEPFDLKKILSAAIHAKVQKIVTRHLSPLEWVFAQKAVSQEKDEESVEEFEGIEDDFMWVEPVPSLQEQIDMLKKWALNPSLLFPEEEIVSYLDPPSS